jgi:hypothetical protein
MIPTVIPIKAEAAGCRLTAATAGRIRSIGDGEPSPDWERSAVMAVLAEPTLLRSFRARGHAKCSLSF